MKAKITFGPNKTFRQVYGVSSPGHFALDAVPPLSPHWDHCREQFAVKFKEGTEGFFFSHESDQGDSVAGFLLKVEDVLDLAGLRNPWPHSTFNKTERKTVTWVVPSPFWKSCELRRSLLTILLRCGMVYDPGHDNFEEALFGAGDVSLPTHEYTRRTRLALLRFLFGYTKFVRPEDYTPLTGELTIHKCGWYTVFECRSVEEIRKILVLPDDEEPIRLNVPAVWT